MARTGFTWRDAFLIYGACLTGVAFVSWPLVRDPAHLWPPHHDSRVFTWVMASMARRLLSHPLTLFHGNAFYPNGESLAYTELLLPPSLLGLPGFLWGDPILTYNLLLLTLWPLNGLAMAWVAHGVTGSRPAAGLAAAVFCLSPYFTEYYLEFQMLLAALVPIVLYCWMRWLETGGRRWLAGALAGLAGQGLTTWYYAVILGLALATLTVAVLCLRWRGWRWRHRLVELLVGGVGVAGVLLPFALPYLAVHWEFGYERGLAETSNHYADVFSFVEAGTRSRLYRHLPFSLTGHIPETSAFVGAVVLALAGGAVWLSRDPARGAARRVDRLILVLLALSLALAGIAAAAGGLRWRWGPWRVSVRPGSAFDAAVLFGLAHLAVRGFLADRARGPRTLTATDWVRCVLFVCGVSALLALGPEIHVGQRGVGPGPYLGLYHLFLPLHVVRTTIRFAVVTVAGLALLGALGLRALEERLAPWPRWRWTLVAAVFAGVALEYAVVRGQYERVSAHPRPVDLALRRDPDEVAVLEWPTNVAATDADAMVRSLVHGKLVVNGLSGVAPPLIPELSKLLTTPASPFPGADARAALRLIHPLRYLVVRLDDPAVTPEWRAVWLDLRHAKRPALEFLGSFGDTDLYRLPQLPERALAVEREVSYEFLRTHPVLRAVLRPLTTSADLDQRVEVRLNDRVLAERPLAGEITLALPVPAPYHAALPNVLTLTHRYRRPPLARNEDYRIGATGVGAPGDLVVRSSGDPQARTGSITLDDVELSPDRRGYNLVALSPAGVVLSAARFDTFSKPTASQHLASWIGALPAGTIVAGAVRDEASGLLDERAVAALRTLGVRGDLRGRFRAAHAFVGVKGAPPGTAAEQAGEATAVVTIGHPHPDRGIELTAFDLAPAAASP